MKLLALAVSLVLLCSAAARAAINCGEPPQTIDKSVVTDTKAKIYALGKVLGPELQNRTELLTKDTLKEYPNAEKALIAQTLISLFCQLLRDSTDLNDRERLDRLDAFSDRVAKIIASPPQQSEQKPIVRPQFSNSTYSLQNKGSEVRNLEYEIFATIGASVRRDNVAMLPGGILTIAAKSPGVIAHLSANRDPLFAIDTDVIHRQLLRTIDRIATETQLEKSGIALNQYTCVRIEYDDNFGNHYRHFLSIRVFHDTRPRFQDMHENKFFFDQCKEDYERYRQTKASYLEFWQDSGRDLLAEKIISNLSRSR